MNFHDLSWSFMNFHDLSMFISIDSCDLYLSIHWNLMIFVKKKFYWKLNDVLIRNMIPCQIQQINSTPKQFNIHSTPVFIDISIKNIIFIHSFNSFNTFKNKPKQNVCYHTQMQVVKTFACWSEIHSNGRQFHFDRLHFSRKKQRRIASVSNFVCA